MVYIAYFAELNLQISDYTQKRRICRENHKYALDENFHGHFCPRRKAAKFCHPAFLAIYPCLVPSFKAFLTMNDVTLGVEDANYVHTY